MRDLLLTSFGTRCKALRNDLGMSQEAFANSIDMDRSYYASIETGMRNVTIRNMKKIAAGFEITLSELVEDIDK